MTLKNKYKFCTADLKLMPKHKITLYSGKKDESKYQRAGQYKRAMFAVASYEGSHIWELLRADTNDEEVRDTFCHHTVS